jgi:hypothetical protein
MKATLKISGIIELSGEDLFGILKEYANNNRKELTPIIHNFIKEKYGYAPKNIQYNKDNLDKVAVIIDSTTDEGATPIGKVTKSVEKVSNEGFTRKWNGLYSAVGEVLETLRKRKKNFISWEDLHAELLDMESDNGKKKLFVIGQDKLPMSVLKHRMAPSQVVRQAKSTPALRGVMPDKKNGGLKF